MEGRNWVGKIMGRDTWGRIICREGVREIQKTDAKSAVRVSVCVCGCLAALESARNLGW